METKSKIGMNLFILGCLLVFVYGSLAYAQIKRWVYNPLEDGRCNSIVYGADNNIYTCGYIDRTPWDFAAVSVNTLGTERWIYTLSGLGESSTDEAKSVAYGEDGNIYAAGYTFPMGSYFPDFTVVSLNPSGAHRWIYTYNGSANNSDIANSVIGGPTSFYISTAGYSTSGTGKDFTVISLYSMVGAQAGLYTYDGPASGDDEANSIVYDSAQNLYAAGYSTGSGTGKDFTVISVEVTGTERWVYTYDGAASRDDEAYSIVYGSDGYLYAAGYSVESDNDKDFTVISLDTLGNERWVYSTTNTNNEKANEIVYGADDHIYAAGYRNGGMNKDDFLVISIDTTGTERWVYSYDGPVDQAEDVAKSIVYGNDNNIYVAGYSNQVTGNSKDFTIISLDTLKNERWVYAYNGQADLNDVITAIVYGDDGYLYAAGYSDGDLFTIISIDPAMKPALWSYPHFLMVMTDSGTTDDRTLKIANIGIETSILNWGLSEQPPVNWLFEDSVSGSLGSGDTVLITITFDATSLVPGVYYDTLVITSNDPDHLTKDVPVKLTVGSPGVEDYPDTQLDDRCELLSSFFNKVISLRFTKPADTPCDIIFYNVLGARVYETTLPSTPGLVILDDKHISRFSRGVYFLSVSRAKKVYPVMKLIKF